MMKTKNKDASKEQKPQVKATYLSRHKNMKKNKETSPDNIAPSAKPPSSTTRKPASSSSNKPETVFKAPEPPVKIVDFRTDTSETSPKRDAAEVDEASDKSKKSRRRHRSSSSISNVNGNESANEKVAESPSRMKPPSTVSKISQSASHRSQTPDASEIHHDDVSVADSIADSSSINGNRIKRTEAERKQYFENQPECGDVEEHRAFCTRCQEWVRLSSKQTYYVRPWEIHRIKCDQKDPREGTYKNLGLVASIPFVVPRTEKHKRALLELDEHAEVVEPNKMKCKTCRDWVDLEKKYDIRSWVRHKVSCHKNNAKMTDLEKALERKLFFLCDKQFASFRDPHTAECAACNQKIALKPDVEYDFSLWLAHKESCRPDRQNQTPTTVLQSEKTNISTDALISQPSTREKDTSPVTSVNTVPFPSQTAIQPQSTGPSSTTPKIADTERQTLTATDTERTLVGNSSSVDLKSSLPASISLKRGRNDVEDTMPHEDTRPLSRLRTEHYTGEDLASQDPLSWFTLPFKAFVRGFKQSITKPDS